MTAFRWMRLSPRAETLLSVEMQERTQSNKAVQAYAVTRSAVSKTSRSTIWMRYWIAFTLHSPLQTSTPRRSAALWTQKTMAKILETMAKILETMAKILETMAKIPETMAKTPETMA